MPADALRIRGRHNAANALAALALAARPACRWRRCCTACASTAASRTAVEPVG
jgi:UDP-N-acetylmuramoylalanine--D-glutamate ligase